jgi:hypothetical protein
LRGRSPTTNLKRMNKHNLILIFVATFVGFLFASIASAAQTDSQGRSVIIVKQYSNVNGAINYDSFYRINVSKTGFTSNSTTINITGNSDEVFFLSQTYRPVKSCSTLQWRCITRQICQYH